MNQNPLNLKQVTTSKGRYYLYKGKRYPSVTTVLSYFTNKEDFLSQWRERIGIDEANRITRRAARIGTIAHDMVSNDLVGIKQPCLENEDKEIILQHYTNILSLVKHRAEKIISSEVRLFNPMGMAGTCDLIADWKFDNGEVRRAIIDFKTKSPKGIHERAFEEYGLQTTIYAESLEDPPEDIVIIGSSEGNYHAQSYVSKTSQFSQTLSSDDFQMALAKAQKECYEWN